MRNWPTDEKAIVIDTEEYSGNFERDMVAFITGQVGECGVGQDNADRAQDELEPHHLYWFQEHVEPTADDHGVLRPASIAPTPGWYNNGRGKHLRDSEECEDLYMGVRHPAYQSVEFVVSEWPPDEIMGVILDRARFFCEHFSEVSRIGGRIGEDCKPLTLTGIRLENRTVSCTTIKRYQPPRGDLGWLFTCENQE
jgi:hypothetical protein